MFVRTSEEEKRASSDLTKNYMTIKLTQILDYRNNGWLKSVWRSEGPTSFHSYWNNMCYFNNLNSLLKFCHFLCCYCGSSSSQGQVSVNHDFYRNHRKLFVYKYNLQHPKLSVCLFVLKKLPSPRPLNQLDFLASQFNHCYLQNVCGIIFFLLCVSINYLISRKADLKRFNSLKLFIRNVCKNITRYCWKKIPYPNVFSQYYTFIYMVLIKNIQK